MKCSDCICCWQADGEEYPTCKWKPKAPGDMPPCECDDEEDY